LNEQGRGLPLPLGLQMVDGGADSSCQGEMSRSDKGGSQVPPYRTIA